MNTTRGYTQEQEGFIRKNYMKMEYGALARAIGKGRSAVSQKITRMGLPSKLVAITPIRSNKSYRCFRTWAGMIQRCTNPKTQYWHIYGGRGIKMSERWMDFKNFLEDMGERPAGYSIDRIDPNGNYEAANCRWIPTGEQSKTTRKYLAATPCIDCESRRHSDANGRCHRCSEYFRRNGIPRPKDDRVVAQLRFEAMSRACSKPVVQMDQSGNTIAWYPSTRAAQKALGLKLASAINNCVKGRCKNAYGYRWRHAEAHERIHANPSWAREMGFLK